METLNKIFEYEPLWYIAVYGLIGFGIMIGAYCLVEAIPAAKSFLMGEEYD